jgi:hypothetical protein
MLTDLADQHGVLLRRDAVAAGYFDKQLKRSRQAGEIVRVRQGAYVLRPVWEQASSVQRHLLLTRVVLQQYDDRVAASHQSACLLQGGPNWGLDLSTVHVTNLYGIGERTEASVTHHRGAAYVNDVTRRDGHWQTSPLRTALDTARLTGRDAAVCVLDWYLHEGLVSVADLDSASLQRTDWSGSLSLLTKVRLSDSRSESVGESRTRLVCVDHRLPLPELQYEVFLPGGRLAGRTDFAWPEYGLLGEFDGMAKYHRLRRQGESIEDVVMREKAREDELRELTGWRMIRITWLDLARPALLAERIRRALLRRAA